MKFVPGDVNGISFGARMRSEQRIGNTHWPFREIKLSCDHNDLGATLVLFTGNNAKVQDAIEALIQIVLDEVDNTD